MNGLVLDAGRLTSQEASCGICGRISSLVRASIEAARELARSDGWRFCGEWGWCCGKCALGDPGVYLIQKAKSDRKAHSRAAAEALGAASSPDRNGQLPLFERSHVRGFGWTSVEDVLDQLLLEEDDPDG